MAVNFVQHNRFNIDDSEARRRRQRQQEEREQNANHNGQKSNVKRATDDYHYDKFKKQFRRY